MEDKVTQLQEIRIYHEKIKERKRIVEKARCELLLREIADIEAEMKG
jgi:hypothetical protein